MSDNIPYEIQLEIIKKCPVKSLLNFRTVSKSWKQFIDSSKFVIERYRDTQPQRLLIRYYDGEYRYVSVADDDTFLKNKSILTLPRSVAKLGLIIGSSLGLFCLFGPVDKEREIYEAVIWNPTIKKTVTISFPLPYGSVFGFGVCRLTYDPKFVKMIDISKQVEKNTTSFLWDVEVYTLSTRVWRKPFGNLPSKDMYIEHPEFQVVVDGVIYWSGVVSSDSGKNINAIISFDLTNEEFGEVQVPSCLAHKHFDINKIRESLVLLHFDTELEPNVCKAWRLDRDGSCSFTKLFTIYVPYNPVWEVRGFQKKNNRLILELREENTGGASLEVYDPAENASVDIGINGDSYLYFVGSYTKSLLLLDQPDN